jgi:hypothetical protein
LRNPNPEATDAQIASAIVDALARGLVDVAQALAIELRDRQRARAPSNIVSIRR